MEVNLFLEYQNNLRISILFRVDLTGNYPSVTLKFVNPPQLLLINSDAFILWCSKLLNASHFNHGSYFNTGE